MENKDVLKLIYIISEIFYKNGKYGLERISLICRMIKQIYNCKNFGTFDISQDVQKLEDFEIKALLEDVYEDLFKIFNRAQIKDLLKDIIDLFRKFSPKDITQAIQQLVDNDSKSSNLIPTDDFSIKFMQSFAKKMSNGYFIDPCIGSGRLLSGLDAKSIIGYDINTYCKDIAETYLYLSENTEEKNRFSLNLSTENFLYLDLRFTNDVIGRTFIFDPPLNETIEKFYNWDQIFNSNNIYNLNDRIPSEYAFLSKILFEIPYNQHTSFICIFANNFLSAQDKFKTSFRKYLFENSLIAVIQSNFSENNKAQKLILVGKKKLDNPHKGLRYFITPKDKNISEKDISRIVEKCLNNETFDEKEFYDIAKIKSYTIEEIRENDYQISMPQYFKDEVNPNKIKSLDAIVDQLKDLNKDLINKSKDLVILTDNLLNGIKNIELDYNFNNKSTNKKQKNWFDYSYSDLNNAIGIFSDDKEIDWTPIDFIDKNYIDLEVLDSCIYHLKLLFKAKRLRYKSNKLEIYSKKELPTYRASEPFSSYIIKSNNKDNFYKKIISNLSSRQVEYLNTYIRYYFDYDTEDETSETNKKLTQAFNQFLTSEKHSYIATLKTLGLLYNNPGFDDGIEKYFPYIAILHIKEDS